MGTQQDVIDLVEQGKNVLATGGAGRGKSHLVRQITNHKTVLCGPTGISSLNIGGATCHSTFGIGHGIQTEDDFEKIPNCVADVFGNREVERLILDEIFNTRADIVDCIDQRLRAVRRVDEPFGGIQTILTGDGYQLPPVVTKEEKRYYRRAYRSPYMFSSKMWQDANFETVLLEKCYRQNAQDQVAILDAIRTQGKWWEQAVERLNDWCSGSYDPSQTLTLCCYKNDAQRLNAEYFAMTSGRAKTYYATKTGKFPSNMAVVEEALTLKIGSRVVIRANSKDGAYKNGHRGIVVDFHPEGVEVELEEGYNVLVEPHKWEHIEYKRGLGGLTKTPSGSFRQIPLALGWAITIHSSQGLTLDNCAVDLGSGAFTYHQTYVALSRIRDLKNMRLTRPITEDDVKVDPKVVKFYKSLQEEA